MVLIVLGGIPGVGPSSAIAQIEHQLVRRLVVFPIQAAPESAQESATGVPEAVEDAWWQARDELTKNRRFLVGSKQFLLKSDVFQPRGTLEPADAIILGKLLDAHALLTMQLMKRRLTLNVYDGTNGLTLFQKSVELHPSLMVKDQLSGHVRRLMTDFMASIPYQGFTSVDSLIGKVVYEEGDVKVAQVDLGVQTGAEIGDIVQWIRLESVSGAPLFQSGGKSTIFAEGKIVRLTEGIAQVEILRATGLNSIKEYSLVRVPREAERLFSESANKDTPRTTLSVELVSPEADPMREITREKKPLATTLSFVGSMAVFLLLAF